MVYATFTQDGLSNLGKMLRYYRTQADLSLRDVAKLAHIQTGHTMAASTISCLERGNTQPTPQTLAILVQCGYIPYGVEQLVAIACGEKAPAPGEIKTEIKGNFPKTAREALAWVQYLPASEKVELAKLVLQSV
jgi:transcriptional regulator with XRE-family HTH domain